MPLRTTEDRLREEYFDLLPEIRRVAEHLETEVRYRVLPIFRSLNKYERVIVRARIKDCDSAVESLRRREEGRTFDPHRVEKYTLTSLRDLAGVRVLAFPGTRVEQIDETLRNALSWTPDPVVGERGETLAFKYWGRCLETDRIFGEYQVASALIGLFWEVEHSAIYKPAASLRGVVQSLSMQERTRDVLAALRAFEADFERLLRENVDI